VETPAIPEPMMIISFVLFLSSVSNFILVGGIIFVVVHKILLFDLKKNNFKMKLKIESSNEIKNFIIYFIGQNKNKENES
jgi:large-conductance mechanosensitive channel